ncbi:hypothetical protein LP420_04790 [Massilia sp. B-10]|nr:hypothetical protein LP420_04790 [Massilia sp. B-10]
MRPIRWTSSSRSIFIRPRWPHEQIVIIGALGYEAQRRHACTPVYSLSLRTFAITRIATTGEGPGWIARHAARLCDGGSAIAIGGGAVMLRADAYPEANLHTWRLDLATWNWTCERRSDWQQCIVALHGTGAAITCLNFARRCGSPRAGPGATAWPPRDLRRRWGWNPISICTRRAT